ncbi:HAD family hydrolase [Tannockella kyphosi]|uniref:HAD family hydrolase n=1 Tax=Tannockella kyphosi TaxID=2899121 RepID=UPI00201227DC|nr:HAD family hydrolase [Tannockella kyphosi]
MENKKILFFDIDGTLTDEQTHTVPDSCKVALLKAKEKGHILIVNTGRPFSILDSYLFDLGFDGFVCGCGTNIYFKDEELFHFTLTSKRCKELVESTRKYKLDGVFEGRNIIYFTDNHRIEKAKIISTSLQSRGFKVGNLEDEIIDFDKGVVFFDEQSDYESFAKEVTDFDCIERGPGFRELVPAPYSKATGIQFIADYLGISVDDCYVFGDSNNDLAMLKYVKHSVVMGNAEDPSLKELAYFVTKDINDDGIAYALEQLKII